MRWVSVLCGMIVPDGRAATYQSIYGTTPTVKPNGEKWRLGYLQAGEYKDYLPVFRAIIIGLANMGWINTTQIPEISAEDGTKKLWEWLSAPDRSMYLEFVPNAYYSGDWTPELRQKIKARVLDRLNTQMDIDLMFALGTWAGQDLANNQHSVKTMVFSTSDPIGSKIIKSVDDSGFDHIWARVDPTRYERQVTLFHDIFDFKRLGVVFEDSVEGRTYGSVDKVELVASRRAFKLVPCTAQFSRIPEEEAMLNVLRCHEELAPQIDAFYITHHRGVQSQAMKELLAPFFKYNVPTFSMAGSDEVRLGALLSLSQANFIYAGKFYAETLAPRFSTAPCPGICRNCSRIHPRSPLISRRPNVLAGNLHGTS